MSESREFIEVETTNSTKASDSFLNKLKQEIGNLDSAKVIDITTKAVGYVQILNAVLNINDSNVFMGHLIVGAASLGTNLISREINHRMSIK